MGNSRLWLLFIFLGATFTYGAYDASNIVRSLEKLNKKDIGKTIGLKFKNKTFQIKMNNKNILFDVVRGHQKYSKTPGDRLLAQSQQGEVFQLNSGWKIVKLNKDYITLENRVYENAEGKLIRILLPKSSLEGYYEPLSKTTDWLIMSLFVVLAAVGTQL